MSRGFVKEDDQEDVPFVAPRAYLPQGTTNYVTPAGMEALLAERDELLNERNQWQGHNENERRVAFNHINARLTLLDERISSARVISPGDKPSDEVRFGNTVVIKDTKTSETQTLQITGVDEANPSKGKLSFISPLSRLLTNKKVGDKIKLKRNIGDVEYLIVEIR